MIRIGREIQCLLYAGFFLLIPAFDPDPEMNASLYHSTSLYHCSLNIAKDKPTSNRKQTRNKEEENLSSLGLIVKFHRKNVKRNRKKKKNITKKVMHNTMLKEIFNYTIETKIYKHNFNLEPLCFVCILHFCPPLFSNYFNLI